MSSIVPDGWIRGRLDSVVSKFIVPMRDKPKTFSGDIPWVRIEDFYGKYLSRSKSGRNVDRTTINDMNLKVYPKGTVLCSCSARLGVCTITSKELVSNQTFIGLYPSDSIDAEMLFYTMESHSEDLQKLSSGTTIAYLPREKFEEFEILVPPLPEQKKIASILTSVDEVIENTQKQIDKLQDLKKATMNELLTKGIGHTEFKDSELGRIPRSWANISMDEALKCKILDSIQDGNHGGQHPKSSDYVIDGIPFVMASDLRNGKVDVSRAKKIPTDVYEGLRIGFAKVGDVLLTHKATIGEVAVVDEDCGDIMCTPQVTYYRIKDAERLSSRFLFYWFQSQPFQRELFRVSGQSTRDYIGIKAQKELFIRIPPVTEQNRITSILAAVDNKISKVEEKLTQTQSLKKSLMQDLLTGKVRVTVN